MKEHLAKWWKWRVVLLAVLVVGLYFATRIYKLTLIPVFVDEAIYVRWAQVMRNEPTLRFLPLSDGKQPLFMWVTMPFFKLFSDPLVAGRMVSVMSGFGTLIGVVTLVYLLTGLPLIALAGAFIYTVAPYTLFFDRMALVDSMLAMWAIWILIIGLQLAKKPRLDLAMILGFFLGFGLLTKSPAFYFWGMQLLLIFSVWPLKKERIFKLLGCLIVSSVIAFSMYNVLRLGPNFNLVNSRNQDYVFSFSEVLTHPLNPLVSNSKRTSEWMLTLLTLPVVLLALASLANKKRLLKTIIIWVWVIAPLIFQGSIAKVYTTRYLLFSVPLIIVLAALGLENLREKWGERTMAVISAFTISFCLMAVKPLYSEPHSANLPRDMKFGYMEEWTAGYGQKEVADYLAKLPRDKKILVGTEGYFGTLPDGLQIYTQHLPNVNVIGVGWPISSISDKLTSALAENEVYLVVNKSRYELSPDLQKRLELIGEYPKSFRPDGTREALLFFKLKP